MRKPARKKAEAAELDETDVRPGDKVWVPHDGPQTDFFESDADEILYGGAGGGGKTMCATIDPLRQVGAKAYTAIVFRRTYPELEMAKGVIEISRNTYRAFGAVYNESKHFWKFPSGARVYFGHMEHENDYLNYDGAGFNVITFDELATFTEQQYTYLLARLRTEIGSGIRCYVRATSNPPKRDQPGKQWIKKRWAAWLDKKHPRPAKSGEIRWYKKLDDDTEIEAEADDPKARSRTFIAASWRDNPSLDQEDYERQLDALPYVDKMRLKEGDWDIEEGEGLVISKKWFLGKILTEWPEHPKRSRFVRYWDFAATEAEIGGKKIGNPDWTATCLSCMVDKKVTYAQIMRQRLNWGDVEKWVLELAAREPGVVYGWEEEGGSSGKKVTYDFVSKLQGVECRGIRSSKDKLTRANRWTPQAQAGNVYLIVSPATTIEETLEEFNAFPSKKWKDDQVDAMSGSYQMLLEVPDEDDILGIDMSAGLIAKEFSSWR